MLNRVVALRFVLTPFPAFQRRAVKRYPFPASLLQRFSEYIRKNVIREGLKRRRPSVANFVLIIVTISCTQLCCNVYVLCSSLFQYTLEMNSFREDVEASLRNLHSCGSIHFSDKISAKYRSRENHNLSQDLLLNRDSL